jgi:3-hydroxy-9,10-secoandrosta-1,3,5(10)-triene-9,17-dione monooxygenase
VTARDELLARARELRAHLRERPANAGAFSEDTQTRLRDAGFHRMLVPRRFGGAEADLDTFLGVVRELARGCPATAWCVAVLAGGPLRVRAVLEPAQQAELLADTGFVCASGGAGAVRAVADGGGWVLDGTLQGCLGAGRASHLLGRALAASPGEPLRLVFVAPRNRFEALDEDGGAVVRFERARIGGELARLDAAAAAGEAPEAPPDPWGTGVGPAARAAVFAGAAVTAAEILEALVRTEPDPESPGAARLLDADHQRWLGAALCRSSAAEILLQEAASVASREPLGWEEGAPASPGAALLLGMLAHESMRFSSDAIGGVLRAARPADPAAAAELGRIGRVLLTGSGDPWLAPEEAVARRLARHQLGLAPVA